MNKFYLSHYDISDPTEVDIVYGAFILCRTSRLKELNGFDERFYFYSEEMDLCKRHQTLGGRVVYFPKTAIIHLGGQTTKSMPWFKYKNQAISYVQIYQKYFTGWRFLSVITFHYVGLVIRVPIFVLLGIVTFSKQHFVRAYYNFKQIFIYPKNLFKS
jgi:GT2 family glycosyltransferase